MCSYIESGMQQRGARLVMGGLLPAEGPLAQGYFTIPTIFAGVANYGLAAYVWTHDVGHALRAAHAIESGFVQANQGLGQFPGQSYGGFKESGIGQGVLARGDARQLHPSR